MVERAGSAARLAQALDRVAAKLREFVEEQHPVLHQGSRMYLED
jgi:hypothetical protein